MVMMEAVQEMLNVVRISYVATELVLLQLVSVAPIYDK